MNNKCISKRPEPTQRHRATLAIDGELWQRFKPALRDNWGGSLTSWIEYAMECYTREECAGCPYEEEEGQQKADGVCRIVDDETE